jgi:hypothetical protein
MASKLRSTAAILLLTVCSTDYHDGSGPVWGRSLAPPAGGPSVLPRAQQQPRPTHHQRTDQHQQREQSRTPARPYQAVPRARGRVNTGNNTGGERQAGEQYSRVSNTISASQAQETSRGADRGQQTPHEPSSLLTNDGIEHYASEHASRTGNHAYNSRYPDDHIVSRNPDDQIVFPNHQGEPIDESRLDGVRDHTSFNSDGDSLDGDSDSSDSDSSDSEDDNADNNTFVAHDNAARAVTRQQAGGVDLTQWGGDPAAAIWDLHRLGVM